MRKAHHRKPAPIGSALAGYAIAPLLETFGWRAPFLFGAVLAAVAGAVAMMILPESVDYLVHRRPAGALDRYNTIARRMRLPEADTLPPPPACIEATARIRDLLSPTYFRPTVFLWLGYALLIAAFYFANTWTAKMTADATGNVADGIAIGMLVALGGVPGALIFAALTTWFNSRIATMLVVAAGSMVFYLYAQNVGQGMASKVLAFLVGVCANGGVAAFFAISPAIYPTVLRSTGVGLMIGFGRGVAMLAPLFTGYMLSLYWTPVEAYKFFGAVMLASAICVVMLDRIYRRRQAMVPDRS